MNRMNRLEIEQKIMDKFIEILNLYEQYNPEGEYLTVTFRKHKSYKRISGNNSYWKEDENFPISFSCVI